MLVFSLFVFFFFKNLLPLKLDLSEPEVHDCILWPVTEKRITPQTFAHFFVKDNNLPESLVGAVTKLLSQQIAHWEHIWTKKNEQLKEGASSDIRVIELEVDLGKFIFKDKFEWDINNMQNAPATFAEVLVHDLALKR